MPNPPLEDRLPARIFIVGFMGAGKTTVGQELAACLGREFIDLDTTIEAREGLSVREIFESRGERVFRSMERDAIARCRMLNRAVIALGGGAYIADDNRAMLRE